MTHKVFEESQVAAALHHVRDFLKYSETPWQELADDPACHGQGLCLDASEEFVAWCKQKQVLMNDGLRIAELGWFAGNRTYAGSVYHYVVVVWGNVIIDLTARQFDDDLPFPHVWVLPIKRGES